MNRFITPTVTRLQALACAFVVTLVMLGAINGLAVSEPPAALAAAGAADQA